jgi:hypothetical protein
MRLPGFTAEHSLHRGNGASFAAMTRDSFGSKSEIRPQQLFCWWNGDRLICGDPPFGGGVHVGGDHATAQCRSHCYHTKHGAALTACLAEC